MFFPTTTKMNLKKAKNKQTKNPLNCKIILSKSNDSNTALSSDFYGFVETFLNEQKLKTTEHYQL